MRFVTVQSDAGVSVSGNPEWRYVWLFPLSGPSLQCVNSIDNPAFLGTMVGMLSFSSSILSNTVRA